MNCPKCGTPISDQKIAQHLAAKGGAAGRGDAKRRTKDQARKAANARWAKERKNEK